MKKIVLLFVIVFMIVAISGCGVVREPDYSSQGQDGDSDSPQSPIAEPVQDEKVADTLFSLGLGTGVNALTAKAAVGGSRLGDVFDESLISVNDIGTYSIGSSHSVTISKESIMEEIVSYNTKLVQGSSANASVGGLFSAGFDEKFALETASKSELNIHQYYYILKQYISGDNYQMKNYSVPSAYTDKLSPILLGELDRLAKKGMTAEDAKTFFDQFGTHVRMAVIYGGMVEVYYATYSKGTIDTVKIRESLDMAINAGLKLGTVDASATASLGISTSAEGTVVKNDSMTNLYISLIGGSPARSLSFESFAASYSDWVNEMADKDRYSIVDVADGGLVPIWSYFPSQYAEQAKILSDYFYEEATKISVNWSEKLEPPVYNTQTYDIELVPKNCEVNNRFDTTKPSADKPPQKAHNPHVVDLYLCGCEQAEDGTYIIRDKNKFEVGFRFLQGASDREIELTDTPGSWLHANISDNPYSETPLGTKIKGRQGKGAYYFKVYYKDGKAGDSSKNYKCDFMRNHTKGDTVSILSASILDDGYTLSDIDKIEVTCVYEIAGWWWSLPKERCTLVNWRCDCTIEFD